MLSEMGQSQEDDDCCRIHRPQVSGRGGGGGRQQVAPGGNGAGCLRGTGFSFGKMKKFRRWTVVMVAPQCERA